MKRKSKNLIIIGFCIQLLAISCLRLYNVEENFSASANTNENSLYVNLVGEVDIGVGYKIRIESDRAYVSSNNGIDIINIQDPTAPSRIGTIEGGMGYDIKDNIVFSTDEDGLVVFDASNAAAPEIIGTSDVGQWAYNVRVNDTLAFAIVNGDMDIYDISNVNNPVRVGQYTDTGRGNDVIIKGGIAYYADPDEGLEVINVTDQTNPEKIRTVSYTYGAWDLYLNDDLLYLGCHGLGFKILDISNPTLPVVIKSFNDGGEVYGVCGNSTFIFLGDLQEGAEVLNYTNNSPLVEIASYTATPHDIEFRGNYLYLADQDNGFLLLELSDTYVENTNEVSLFFGLIVIPLVGVKIAFEHREIIREKNRKTTEMERSCN